MITKTVTSGERSAQAVISEETRFIFSDKWNFFHVQNMGTGNVYISMVAGKAGGDDGVITVLPGCSACSSHSFPANSVYITADNATDVVEVVGSNTAISPFKPSVGGGDIDLSPYLKKADLDVGGTNVLVNSGWLNNTTNWALYSANEWSRDTTVQLNGCNSIKHSRAGLSADSLRTLTSANIPCRYGETYTASVWLRTSDYTAIDGITQPRLMINLRDSAGVYISGYYAPLALTTNDTWIKRTISGIVNVANVAYISLQVIIYRNGTLWAACPKLERGATATDYSPSPKDLIGTPVTLFSGTPSTSSGTPSTISNGTFDGYRNIIIEYTNGSSISIATDLNYGAGKVCAYHADGSTIDTITFVSNSTFYVSSAKAGTYKIYGVV